MKLAILLVCILLSGATTVCRAEITSEKRHEIDRMLKLVGMQALADQMMNQMVEGFKTNMTDVSPEYWDSFSKRFNASDFIERIVPLYDKYYSLEDLRVVNEFYSSPTGQRVLKTLPGIMKESMAIGEAWGREIAEKAVEDVKAMPKAKEKEHGG